MPAAVRAQGATSGPGTDPLVCPIRLTSEVYLMAASRPARSGRHGSNLVCALPGSKSARRTGPPDPSDREADQADGLTALERRFVASLGAELGDFIRERIKAGQPQQEVIASLRRTAPAALLLSSLAHV